MQEKIEFSSLKELYERVSPALYSKVQELKRLGFKFASEKDVWNYLVEHSWKNRKNLELHELISDILYADNHKINDYIMDKLNKLKDKESIIIDRKDLM